MNNALVLIMILYLWMLIGFRHLRCDLRNKVKAFQLFCKYLDIIYSCSKLGCWQFCAKGLVFSYNALFPSPFQEPDEICVHDVLDIPFRESNSAELVGELFQISDGVQVGRALFLAKRPVQIRTYPHVL